MTRAGGVPEPRFSSSYGYCDVHGKRLYATKKKAKQAVRSHPNRAGMREYRCTEVDGGWHVGHLPQRVRTGDCTADEWYGREAS